jgi:hypothetical protein
MRTTRRPQRRAAREATTAEPDEAGLRMERVRRDLELRGVAPAVARSVAAAIASRAVGLAPEAYAAFLDGVAAGHGAAPADVRAESGALEIQRLVNDFAVELKKLDEGLRLLSSYLLRIRDRAGNERPRVVH